MTYEPVPRKPLPELPEGIKRQAVQEALETLGIPDDRCTQVTIELGLVRVEQIVSVGEYRVTTIPIGSD